uniref:Uncharacterized protein n=1 Tax=Anguilla anguilla TaxID=7936 RepID=A0A0E9QTU1_ANGAN
MLQTTPVFLGKSDVKMNKQAELLTEMKATPSFCSKCSPLKCLH